MSLNSQSVTIYTDGACIGNPGPGGYGAVLIWGHDRQEISGGYRLTTNNRMEMIAAISALESLPSSSCQVMLYSDSQYLINAINKGWAKKWQANNWQRNAKEKAKNPDLWAKLLALGDRHHISWHWVRGHAGHVENERCDRLAVSAARQPNLAIDLGFKP